MPWMPRTLSAVQRRHVADAVGSTTPTTRRAPARARATGRWPRAAAPPVLVETLRGGIVESRQRGHVVQVGADGTVERGIGDPEIVVTLRSAAKPFAILTLVESGAADAFSLTEPELALMAASHSGEDIHVRTLQSILRRAGLSQSLLACGAEGMPLDKLTAKRLHRDGELPGPIRHMCSGHHIASLLLSKHSAWSLEDYYRAEHPSQQIARADVARAFGTKSERMKTAVDACGLPTYAFPLVEVARAFARLADPAGSDWSTGVRKAATRIRDAMVTAPEMVGGTRDEIDAAVMRAANGTVLSKSGAEGLRGVSLLEGSRGAGSEPAGMAISIEDGDPMERASQAATVEALAQLGVYDDDALDTLDEFHRPPTFDPRGQRTGESVARFELAPISELA